MRLCSISFYLMRRCCNPRSGGDDLNSAGVTVQSLSMSIQNECRMEIIKIVPELWDTYWIIK